MARSDFATSLGVLKSEISESLFKKWGTSEIKSNVTDNYALRVFFQQLIYVAVRIDTSGRASANLWVGDVDSNEQLHLRSEEREGFFRIGQLLANVSELGMAEDYIIMRTNKVWPDIANEDQNSVGAQAYLKGKAILVEIAESGGYPSEDDKAAGVTHILGIPLYTHDQLKHLLPAQRIGAPLAITVDMDLDSTPSKKQKGELEAFGAQVHGLFREFHQVWKAGTGVRLNLHKPGSGPGT